jgi:hypothetical protein
VRTTARDNATDGGEGDFSMEEHHYRWRLANCIIGALQLTHHNGASSDGIWQKKRLIPFLDDCFWHLGQQTIHIEAVRRLERDFEQLTHTNREQHDA